MLCSEQVCESLVVSVSVSVWWLTDCQGFCTLTQPSASWLIRLMMPSKRESGAGPAHLGGLRVCVCVVIRSYLHHQSFLPWNKFEYETWKEVLFNSSPERCHRYQADVDRGSFLLFFLSSCDLVSRLASPSPTRPPGLLVWLMMAWKRVWFRVASVFFVSDLRCGGIRPSYWTASPRSPRPPPHSHTLLSFLKFPGFRTRLINRLPLLCLSAAAA